MEIPKGDWGVQFRWSLSDAARQSALRRHRGATAALRLMYDNDGLWDWGEPAEGGPRLLRGMVDQYADAGASALVWGCGNNLAWSYTPREQELWCDRVPTDEPGLRALAERQRAWLTAGTQKPASLAGRHQRQPALPALSGACPGAYLSPRYAGVTHRRRFGAPDAGPRPVPLRPRSASHGDPGNLPSTPSVAGRGDRSDADTG